MSVGRGRSGSRFCACRRGGDRAGRCCCRDCDLLMGDREVEVAVVVVNVDDSKLIRSFGSTASGKVRAANEVRLAVLE